MSSYTTPRDRRETRGGVYGVTTPPKTRLTDRPITSCTPPPPEFSPLLVVSSV